MPIVSNNEIIPAFVKIPKDDECQNVPMTKIVEVKEQMKMLVGQNGKVNGQNCQVYGAKLRYNSVDEYVAAGIIDASADLEHLKTVAWKAFDLSSVDAEFAS